MKAFRKLNFKHSFNVFLSSPRVLALRWDSARGFQPPHDHLEATGNGGRGLPDLSNPEDHFRESRPSNPILASYLRLPRNSLQLSPCLHLPLKSIFRSILVIFHLPKQRTRGHISHFYSSPSRRMSPYKTLLFFTLWLLQARGRSSRVNRA